MQIMHEQKKVLKPDLLFHILLPRLDNVEHIKTRRDQRHCSLLQKEILFLYVKEFRPMVNGFGRTRNFSVIKLEFYRQKLTDFSRSSNSHRIRDERRETCTRKSTEFCHHLSIKADKHPLRKKVKPSGKKHTGKKSHKRQIYTSCRKNNL